MPGEFIVTAEQGGVSLTLRAPGLQQLVGIGLEDERLESLFQINKELIQIHLGIYLSCLMGAIPARDLPLLAKKMAETLNSLEASVWLEKGQNN